MNLDPGTSLNLFLCFFSQSYDHSGSALAPELKELSELRESACYRPDIETLRKYYCQATFLKHRFQMDKYGFSWIW